MGRTGSGCGASHPPDPCLCCCRSDLERSASQASDRTRGRFNKRSATRLGRRHRLEDPVSRERKGVVATARRGAAGLDGGAEEPCVRLQRDRLLPNLLSASSVPVPVWGMGAAGLVHPILFSFRAPQPVRDPAPSPPSADPWQAARLNLRGPAAHPASGRASQPTAATRRDRPGSAPPERPVTAPRQPLPPTLGGGAGGSGRSAASAPGGRDGLVKAPARVLGEPVVCPGSGAARRTLVGTAVLGALSKV